MKPFLDGQNIGIFRVAETDEFADYLFCCGLWVPDENEQGKYRQHQTNFGRVRINKQNGETEVIHIMPGDIGERRAAATICKLQQHWRKGELPQVTQWASG